MKFQCLLTGVFLLSLSAHAADSTPKSSSNFSDSTKVEVVALPDATGNMTLTNVVQIKQQDGTICYAIVQIGNSSSYPNSISCLRP
ncbi:hypothetical protein [Bdellovibrio svalbardensis]|uniref:Uncharacterized protein n=1 Tax=Bdellovibrio svalbardensis TaxID=2972972 RepID=A0ABT6DIN6_9BACT|nr:hypothetical protein [Bdellovibrio svalbardensis]MDG0816716.1 hypothetical protein [Bdellovibrio svalbardensis]